MTYRDIFETSTDEFWDKVIDGKYFDRLAKISIQEKMSVDEFFTDIICSLGTARLFIGTDEAALNWLEEMIQAGIAYDEVSFVDMVADSANELREVWRLRMNEEVHKEVLEEVEEFKRSIAADPDSNKW